MAANILQRNNVKVSGGGTKPLLFAHGFGCDQHMWRFVAPALENDYKVILFDYVGSGKSDISAYDPERYSTLDGYARDVLDICGLGLGLAITRHVVELHGGSVTAESPGENKGAIFTVILPALTGAI